ncbi:hypothetical protein [Streptomyces sp. NPDC048445]|uniref:hypothetical protein n=1 Tax=Streptomyces sp. NPDC048445 TaxID=3365553 RepID=UPI00371E5F78
MVAQPNTAAPLSDADAAMTDPDTRFVRANTLVSADHSRAEQFTAHNARTVVQDTIKAAAAAPGHLTPRGAAADAAAGIQRAAAEAAAAAAGMPASEGELSAFVRATYAYRDTLVAEAVAAGQDPAVARHVAAVTTRGIVRAIAGEAS